MPPTQGNGMLVADGRWPKPSLGPSRLGGPGPPCSGARKKPSSCNHSGWQRGFRLPIVAVPTSQRASRWTLPQPLIREVRLEAQNLPAVLGQHIIVVAQDLLPCGLGGVANAAGERPGIGCDLAVAVVGILLHDGPLFATAITHGGKHIRAAIGQTPSPRTPTARFPTTVSTMRFDILIVSFPFSVGA